LIEEETCWVEDEEEDDEEEDDDDGSEDTFLEGALGAMVIGLPLAVATGNVSSSTVFDTVC
jgi:hypothetical protein